MWTDNDQKNPCAINPLRTKLRKGSKVPLATDAERSEWELSRPQEYFWLSEAKKIIYCFLPKASATATCSEWTIKLLNKTRTLMLTAKTSSTVCDPSSAHR